MGDVSEELLLSNEIQVLNPGTILNGVSAASENVLEKTTNSFSGGLLVDFKVSKVFAGSGVPLMEEGILIFHWTLSRHSHIC